MDIVEGDNVRIYISENDIFTNTAVFKNHREYIQHRFKQLGYEITQWYWDKKEDGTWTKNEDGIQFKKTDSDITLMLEVTGTIGKSLRRIQDVESK